MLSSADWYSICSVSYSSLSNLTFRLQLSPTDRLHAEGSTKKSDATTSVVLGVSIGSVIVGEVVVSVVS